MAMQLDFQNIKFNFEAFPQLLTGQVSEWLSVSASTFLLIFPAEFGDKSQLVCMGLAARYHNSVPILLGAISAFAILNLLAVCFGSAVAAWIPEGYLVAGIALLFAGFGVLTLRARPDDSNEAFAPRTERSLFWSTFLVICIAEFGDKTQLVVASLGSTLSPVSVWVGATLALITTTAIGLWAGQSVLKKMPMIQVHRISGIIFLGFAFAAGYRLFVIVSG